MSQQQTRFSATMDEVTSRILKELRTKRQHDAQEDEENTFVDDTTPFIDDGESEGSIPYVDHESVILTPLRSAHEPPPAPRVGEEEGNSQRKLSKPLYFSIQRQANNLKDDPDGFALLQALVQGNIDDVNRWVSWHISKGSLKTLRYGSDRLTALIVATSGCCNLRVVNALLDAGVDPNGADWTGRTPLLVAAVCGKDECTKALLRKGANANSGYKKSHGMRISEAMEDMEWLKKEDEYMSEHDIKSPDINVDGLTSLHLAALANSLVCLKLLLEYKADSNAKDSRGLTPLMLAGDELDAGDRDAVRIYEGIVEALTTHGAEMKGIGEHNVGTTALHRAAELDAPNALSLLLKNKCDPNWCVNNLSQQTPLHVAAETAAKSCAPDPTCISTLISYGADLSSENEEGLTALKIIVTEVSRPKKFLHSVLDSQISLSEYTCELGEEVTVNFKSMSPVNIDNQEKVLHALLDEDSISRWMRYDLFRHPFLKSFVIRKWSHLKKFFYVYVVVCLVHALSLSAFVTLIHSDVFHLFGGGQRASVMQKGIPISRIFVVLTSILVLVNVSWMCYVFPHRYPLSFEAWRNIGGSLLSIIVSVLTVYDGDSFGLTNRFSASDSPGNREEIEPVLASGEIDLLINDTNNDVNYTDEIPILQSRGEDSLNGWNESTVIQAIAIHCTAIAIFQAWVDLMLLVGRFPWASDALLFTTVLKNVLRVLATYGFMIVGFAFVFFLEFREVDLFAFGDPWRALLKTMVMMMGEFDYMDTFAGEEKGSAVSVAGKVQIYTQAIFLGFVVIASIALMNLMLGLAVSDTQELAEESSQRQLMKLAESVVHWGTAVHALERLCGRYSKVKHWFNRCRIIPDELIFPTNLKKSAISRELMKELLEIALKYHDKHRQEKSRKHLNNPHIPRKLDSYISKDSAANPNKTSDPFSQHPEISDANDVIQCLRNEIAELREMRQEVSEIKELLENYFNGEESHMPLIRTLPSDDSSRPLRRLTGFFQRSTRNRRSNRVLSEKPKV